MKKIVSHYAIKTYFKNIKEICLEQELNVIDPLEAVIHAKSLKKLNEIKSIIVVEKAEGYIDRIIYEFEREGDFKNE